MYIYMHICIICRTSNAHVCAPLADNLIRTRAHLDVFIVKKSFRPPEVLFRVQSCSLLRIHTSRRPRNHCKIRKTGYCAGENERQLDMWQREPSKGRKINKRSEIGLGAQPRLAMRGGNKRGLGAQQRQTNKSRKS